MPALPQANPQRQNPLARAPFEPQREFAKLAALHDEARETALLANLLGRAPYVAGALAFCTIVVACVNFRRMPMPEIATWSVLMLIGIGAIARSYTAAISAPFERASLRGFASDLTAIMAYCGFAWGSGAYLAIDSTTAPLALVMFAAVPCIAVAVALQQRDSVLFFAAPVTALGAFAAVLRPLPDAPLAAAFVLIACALVSGAIFWISGRKNAEADMVKIAELAVS